MSKVTRTGAPPRRRPSRRAKRWRRFYTGLRRDLERNQPILFGVAALVGLATLYGVWSSGVLGRTGERMGAVGASMLSAGGLDVDTVAVEGGVHVEKADVIGALALKDPESLLKFDAETARARVERLPWVETASVARLFPDRLHVVVSERDPYAIWQHGGAFYLIDREGHPLEMLTAASIKPFSHLPHVVGEGANAHAASLLELLEEAPTLKYRLKAASRVGNRRWNLALDNGITVRLPDTEVAKAIQDIITLDSQHRLLARNVSVIDLRLPDVLIVRPQGGEGTTPASGSSGTRRVIIEDRKV